MSGVVGCREVQVLTSVTSGAFVTAPVVVEVTNNNASDVLFYPNDYAGQGHPTNNVPAYGIPIKAGTTREIPMQISNFNASGAVTVVAYFR